jgi:hypothetical protein
VKQVLLNWGFNTKGEPARLDVPPGQPNVVCADDMQPAPAWLEYPFCKFHPIFRWLPSKLGAWISYNHGHELGIPPKCGLEWRAGEFKLNAILENNLIPSQRGKSASDILLHSVGV